MDKEDTLDVYTKDIIEITIYYVEILKNLFKEIHLNGEYDPDDERWEFYKIEDNDVVMSFARYFKDVDKLDFAVTYIATEYCSGYGEYELQKFPPKYRAANPAYFDNEIDVDWEVIHNVIQFLVNDIFDDLLDRMVCKYLVNEKEKEFMNHNITYDRHGIVNLWRKINDDD